MKNAAEVGAFMIDRLRELQQKHQIIGDVRGRGLMIGIELVRDRVTKERATTERDRIVDACFKRGLLLLGAGKNSIRISPPLVLTKAQAASAVEILDQAFGELVVVDRRRSLDSPRGPTPLLQRRACRVGRSRQRSRSLPLRARAARDGRTPLAPRSLIRLGKSTLAPTRSASVDVACQVTCPPDSPSLIAHRIRLPADSLLRI